MAKKAAKKTTTKKKTAAKPSPAEEGVVLYATPDLAEREAELRRSEEIEKKARAERAAKLKKVKGRVEGCVRKGRDLVDLTFERVMSQMRHRLSERSQVDYLDAMDDTGLNREVIGTIIRELTKLKDEDLK